MTEVWAIAAIAAVALSGILAAMVGYRTRIGDWVFAGVSALGSVLGLFAGVRGVWRDSGRAWTHGWRVPGGVFEVRVDALAGVFLVQVFLIGLLGTIFGLGYWSAKEHPATAGRLRIVYGLMMAGMALLVIARNSILFLVGWETMALAAFLAVTAEEHQREVRESGFVYLVSARVGTLLVIAAFAVLHSVTGSFSLSVTGLHAGSRAATAIFVLGLAGFGLKAGLMPLHVWLPGAHANAPSHVSALMSGVVIKMGIYGLFRLCSWFSEIPIWWGVSVLSIGMISAVLGVVFAIGQHDLKRLLAYHSVENIGIIAMGFGVALLGRATGDTLLMVLGFSGAMLHVFNHGLFKALLFLGAGSVIHATGTREIDALGGLARKLPRTALAFLIGAVAICGLPPLNGFVSELFVYLGMFRAASVDLGTVGIAAAFGVPVLGLVGALAVLCFVKVFGVVFLGEPRSAHGQAAHESPGSMLGPMAVLAAGCIAIGVLPPLVAPVLDRTTTAWLGSAPAVALGNAAPLGAIAWMGGLLVASLIAVALVQARLVAARAVRGPTWDCGYAAPSARMQYTASSFAEQLVGMFEIALRPRAHGPDLVGPFPNASQFESHVPEVVLDLGILPAARWLGRVAQWFRWLQNGNVHLYMLYVLGTLLLMLFVWR